MLQPKVSNILLIASSVYSTFLVGEVTSQTTPQTSKRERVPINPCEFSDPDYAFGMTACVWRELPKSVMFLLDNEYEPDLLSSDSEMTSRFNNRFKELVGLDDDGVFDLLCKSIDNQGDILVEAFAREYVEAKEQDLFLETVLKCHDEVLASGNIQPTKQVKFSGKKSQSSTGSLSQRKITTDHARNSKKIDIPL